MRLIHEYFESAIDRPLYHYTGISALLGIIESESLWVSNVYYMNDSEEIIYACDLLDQVIEPQLIFGDKATREYEFLRQFQTWARGCRSVGNGIYVFSLSEEPSLLSQWRSYTPHGKGVSIKFGQGMLAKIIKNTTFKLAKCLYQRVEQEEILRGLLEKLITTFSQDKPTPNLNAHVDQSYHEYLEKFRGDTLQVLSIIKHGAFSEEKEWRLISEYYPSYTRPEIKFREGSSMLIPYIQLGLPEDRPCFEQVILGPSQHTLLSMSALSMYLSNKKMCNDVLNSQIPFRQW